MNFSYSSSYGSANPIAIVSSEAEAKQFYRDNAISGLKLTGWICGAVGAVAVGFVIYDQLTTSAIDDAVVVKVDPAQFNENGSVKKAHLVLKRPNGLLVTLSNTDPANVGQVRQVRIHKNGSASASSDYMGLVIISSLFCLIGGGSLFLAYSGKLAEWFYWPRPYAIGTVVFPLK